MAVSTQPAVALCCALALGLGSAPAAKASPPLHYSTDAYRGKATASSKRRALAQALAQRLGSRTLHIVEAPGVKPQQVKPNALTALPDSVLRAAYQMTNPRLVGAEADFLIPLPSARIVPVTGWSDRRGNLTIEAARSPNWDNASGRTQAQAAPPFRNADGRWTQGEAEVIQSALNRLSERERRHIADLPFIRHRLPVDASHSPNHAGHYYQKGCRREIRVYDRTFASDRFIFVGSPHRPIRNSERTILHEVAHAIAAVPLHRIECALDQLIDQHNDLVESLKADQHRLNEQIVDYNASGNAQRSPQRRHAIERARAALRKKANQKNALARQLNQLRPTAHRLREQMPALVAYQQRANGRYGPTRYGAVSVSESFAESFSLHHTDPAALERVMPGMNAWFDAAKHLTPEGR
ncbi:MAG: hypothetical protein VYB65_14320 [Myxococcota bacterium]|nr:hypothetical protein [Myxococcota bacterium]